MAHYAFLDQNNVVINVIVGIDENELIEGLDPETWYGNFNGNICKRTSYNTSGNKHILGGTPFRKNYAGIGDIYNEILDCFMRPKPYNSWILNEETCFWEPPIPYPDTSNIPEPYNFYNNYTWNDVTVNWDLVQPFPSWILNASGYYEAPITYPTEVGDYYWNEEQGNWVS